MLAGGFDSFPELKREQYFAVNAKNEVFIETLVRYGNRYQADKAAAVNSLFGGENVVDIATPEILPAERWSDLDRLNRNVIWWVFIFQPIRWTNIPLCWSMYATHTWQSWKIRLPLWGVKSPWAASLPPFAGESVRTAILTALQDRRLFRFGGTAFLW